MTALQALPLHGIPEVAPGDDLAALIAAAADARRRPASRATCS